MVLETKVYIVSEPNLRYFLGVIVFSLSIACTEKDFHKVIRVLRPEPHSVSIRGSKGEGIRGTIAFIAK